MIIYDFSQNTSLIDYGIEIPITYDRVIKTIEYLIEHPVIGRYFDDFAIKEVSEKVSKDDLLRVHSQDYVGRLFSDKLENEIIRSYELVDSNGNYCRYNPQNAILPLCKLFENEMKRVSGTLQCCKTALDKGFSFYFGGGSHHAQREYGEGFCILNDIVIALRNLQANHLIKNAWIIDVDAHKGDGTAALTCGDGSITALSVHMAHGWPLDTDMYIDGKLNPSFIPSDIDIPVSAGEEGIYISKLEEGLSRLALYPLPQIAVVVSGVDPYEKDELPSTRELNLSLEQMEERDLLIYNFLKERKIPQATLMAGGYGDEGWNVHARFLEHVLSERIQSIR